MFVLAAPRLEFTLGVLFEFRLLGAGVPAGLAFTLVGRLAFALVLRLRFVFALAFRLSLAFLLAGFFFALLSLALAFGFPVLMFSDFFSTLVFSFAFVEDTSPSLVGRLMSTATVCPTLTTSPAWGS